MYKFRESKQIMSPLPFITLSRLILWDQRQPSSNASGFHDMDQPSTGGAWTAVRQERGQAGSRGHPAGSQPGSAGRTQRGNQTDRPERPALSPRTTTTIAQKTEASTLLSSQRTRKWERTLSSEEISRRNSESTYRVII